MWIIHVIIILVHLYFSFDSKNIKETINYTQKCQMNAKRNMPGDKVASDNFLLWV
jgi:hypothetical protein